MMPVRKSLARFLIFVVAVLAATSILHAQSDEFHYGYGGISIKAGGEPDNVRLAGGKIESYSLSGYWFEWKHDAYDLRLLVASVFGARTWIVKPEIDVVQKWKAEFLKQLGPKAVVRESPFTFQGSEGFEIRTTGKQAGVTRVFSVKSQLIAATILVDKSQDVDLYQRILDSLRPLTHVERTVAMIEEFAPPTISQNRPKEFSVPDTIELGLVGAVRMVRDTSAATVKTDSRIVQEIHFDRAGFRTREITFNQGYPDVITSWGWDQDKRVNIQAAVNYPPGEGPLGGRSTVVSGSLSIPGFGTYINTGPKYGNRIETQFDSLNRPSIRRRYSNTGELILIEHYKYTDRIREMKTLDSGGGFMGATRETLDATNNVLEIQTLSSDGRVVDSTRFEYEFDPNGNWKVRKGFRKGIGGRPPAKPASVVYRDVRYHDQKDQQRVG